MRRMWLWSLSIFIIKGYSVSCGPTVDKLYKTLMEEYEKDIRPTDSHTIPTNVTFGFLLHSVMQMHAKSQTLKTRAWLNINWMDKRLSWNPSEYNGIKLLQMPFENVWKPDIVVLNNAVQSFGSLSMSTDVYLTSNGNVTWLVSTILNSNCHIEMKQFPFDDQECTINFASWSHSGSDINLILVTEEGDTSSYEQNSEFVLTALKAKRSSHRLGQTQPWPVISIIIKVKRRAFFYVFNHILPGIIVMAMSLIGFIIPHETGEKMTMYTSTMLSMGVYLRAITKIVPESDDASVMGLYYLQTLGMVCVITMLSIMNYNVYANATRYSYRPLPKWVKKLVLGHMAKLLMVDLNPEFVAMKKKFSVFQTMGMQLAMLGNIGSFAASPCGMPRLPCPRPSITPSVTKLSDEDSGEQHLDHIEVKKETHPKIRVHKSVSIKLSGESVRPGHGGDSQESEPLLGENAQTNSLELTKLRVKNRKPKVINPQLLPVADALTATFQNILDSIWIHLLKNDEKLRQSDLKILIAHEWKALSLILDRTLLALFITASAVTTFFFFSRWFTL